MANQFRNSLKQVKRYQGFLGSSGALLGLGILGWSINESIFNVDAGYRAVLFSRITGVGEKIYNEGTHFAIPWLERPYLFDVRAKPRNIGSLTGTKDLQMVNITVRVLSRPSIEHLPTILQSLGGFHLTLI